MEFPTSPDEPAIPDASLHAMIDGYGMVFGSEASLIPEARAEHLSRVVHMPAIMAVAPPDYAPNTITQQEVLDKCGDPDPNIRAFYNCLDQLTDGVYYTAAGEELTHSERRMLLKDLLLMLASYPDVESESLASEAFLVAFETTCGTLPELEAARRDPSTYQHRINELQIDALLSDVVTQQLYAYKQGLQPELEAHIATKYSIHDSIPAIVDKLIRAAYYYNIGDNKQANEAFAALHKLNEHPAITATDIDDMFRSVVRGMSDAL